MFSRTVGIQKTQIENLEAEIDALIDDAEADTLHTTTQPTQTYFMSSATSLKRWFWWDGQQIRGVFGMLKDYFLPLFSTLSLTPTQSSMAHVRWYKRRQLLVHGAWFTTTTGSFSTYTQGVSLGNETANVFSLGTTAEIIDVYNDTNLANPPVLYLVGNSLRRRLGAGAPTTIVDIGVGTPRAGAITANQTVFFRDTTNPNNVQRNVSGVTTTIVTGFSDLYHMQWDETTQKLILFSRTLPNDTTAYKVNADGTGLTLLVPTGNFAAGGTPNFTGMGYVGAEVWGGYLYVPVPGSRYMNTYRKYDIAAGTYVEETLDFGDARSVLAPAVTEAKSYMDAAAGFNAMKQAQFWGSQYYAYLFDRVIHMQRAPTDDAWLLTYESGQVSPLPGAQTNYAWGILPDDGISQKVYPLSDITYRNPDYYLVAEKIYDTAVKEMILEWDATAISAEYPTIVLTFDNGLITATETIRVQFGGDTGSNYDYSFYRNAVSTISNTTAAAQAYLDLYGVNTTTVLGGFYELTIEGYSNTTSAMTFGVQIEGFTATGITTGTINSILGLGKWAKPSSVTFNSVRVFLSGSTASFPTGAAIRLTAYRAPIGGVLP